MPRLRLWLRPPRDLMMLFLLMMLAPAVTLAVLGLRLLEQDKTLDTCLLEWPPQGGRP